MVKATLQVGLPAVAAVWFLVSAVSGWISHNALQAVLGALAALLIGISAVMNAKRQT